MSERKRICQRLCMVTASCVLLSMITWVLPVHGQVDYELPPIDYLEAAVHDPVAQLTERLERGEVSLTFAGQAGYLASVLQALDVPVSSQILVFSKTSFQQAKISPRRPRALYFNDNVYVGWVQQGEVMEVSAIDPQQGAIFYTLEQQPAEQPRFARQTHNCLVCHGSSHTEGVPGSFVRSIYPDRRGHPVLSAGTFRTDYTSPLRERWGGWYVTGTHGKQRHMGNVVLKDGSDPSALDVESGANVVDLADRVDVSRYLTPYSDIVALMVLEHQATAHNRLTAANFSARITAARRTDHERSFGPRGRFRVRFHASTTGCRGRESVGRAPVRGRAGADRAHPGHQFICHGIPAARPIGLARAQPAPIGSADAAVSLSLQLPDLLRGLRRAARPAARPPAATLVGSPHGR